MRLWFLMSSALAGTAYLTVDDLKDGDSATVMGGFAQDECAMVIFDGLDQGTYLPISLDVLVGGSNTGATFIIEVYDSSDTFKVGTRIDDEAFSVTSTTNGTMNRLVFEEAEMALAPMDGNVGVAMCLVDHSGFPGPAVDVGLNHPSQNKIYGDIGTGEQEWWGNAEVGIQGDWIMRLCIEGDDVSGPACPDIEGDADADADADTDSDADTDADTDMDSGGFGILAITPDVAAEGESVDVVITGSGFDYDAEARIGGIALIGQERLGAETITGRSPSSLPAGLHDVEVVRGDGSSDLLIGGFEVTGGCGCGGGPAGGLLMTLLAPLLVLRRRA